MPLSQGDVNLHPNPDIYKEHCVFANQKVIFWVKTLLLLMTRRKRGDDGCLHFTEEVQMKW